MKQSTLGDFDPNKPDTSWPSAWKEWHPVIIAWIFYMIFINISDIYFDNFSFVIMFKRIILILIMIIIIFDSYAGM